MDKQIPWPLIIAHLKNELDEEEEKRFERWLRTPENARLYRELAALWERIQEKGASYTPDTAYYWQQLEFRMNGRPKKQPVISLRKFRIAIAAASILLAITLALAFLYTRETGRYQADNKSVYAALSGKSRLVLPDSSVVWLNAGSTLEYASDFRNHRTVALNGEALFDVVKDDRHPFIVSADDMQVKVHGTRFNVSSYPKETDIKVTLFRGSVSVAAAGQEAYLHPGETALLHKPSQTLDITSADMGFESCWAHESLRFEAQSLRDIARYLEKWYHVKITVDPAVPDTQGYTFTVKDESLEVILRIMARINPIAYTFDENDHVQITLVKPVKK